MLFLSLLFVFHGQFSIWSLNMRPNVPPAAVLGVLDGIIFEFRNHDF